jgi:hypothetical protein
MKQQINEIKRIQQLAGILKESRNSSVFTGMYKLQETKPGSGRFRVFFGNIDTEVDILMRPDGVVYGMSGIDVKDFFQKMVDDQIDRGKI